MSRECKIHGEDYLRCMGGRSAHPSNWYCELCDTSDADLLARYGELNDSEHYDDPGRRTLPFDGGTIYEEILRRMRREGE